MIILVGTVVTTEQLDKQLSNFMRLAKTKRAALLESGMVNPEKRYISEDFEDFIFKLYTLTGIRLYTYRMDNEKGDLESISITLSDGSRKEKKQFRVWEKNLVDQICSFIEDYIIDRLYWEGAIANIDILNGIMSEYNTDSRSISYVVEDSNRKVALLENNKIVFAVSPSDAINFGSTWLARRGELDMDNYGIAYEIDRELKPLVDLYDEENIVDVLYKRTYIHKLLGINILAQVKGIIKRCYPAKSVKIEGDIITAEREGDVVFGPYDMKNGTFK